MLAGDYTCVRDNTYIEYLKLPENIVANQMHPYEDARIIENTSSIRDSSERLVFHKSSQEFTRPLQNS